MIDNGGASFPSYGVVVDPTRDADGNIEVLFADGMLRRLDPDSGSLIDAARVKSDDPEGDERMLKLVGKYVGR